MSIGSNDQGANVPQVVTGPVCAHAWDNPPVSFIQAVPPPTVMGPRPWGRPGQHPLTA